MVWRAARANENLKALSDGMLATSESGDTRLRVVLRDKFLICNSIPLAVCRCAAIKI